MTLHQTFIVAFVLLTFAAALSGCDIWKGSKTVDTDVGEGAMSKESGLITGKRGGVIIYQR